MSSTLRRSDAPTLRRNPDCVIGTVAGRLRLCLTLTMTGVLLTTIASRSAAQDFEGGCDESNISNTYAALAIET